MGLHGSCTLGAGHAASRLKVRWNDISFAVHSLAGSRYHYHNAIEPAFWVALALIPLLWCTPARKPMLFCLIAFAVGWLQMAITKDAGLGAHHVILLWPLPHWFLAVAFVEAAAGGRSNGGTPARFCWPRAFCSWPPKTCC